jgi:hypothetical protein
VRSIFISQAVNVARWEPIAVLMKSAAMLRIVRAVQFIFDKLAALLRGKGSDEMRANEFLGEASCITRRAVDQNTAPSSSDHEIAETNDEPDREKLIRRRWLETGIKNMEPRSSRRRTCSS